MSASEERRAPVQGEWVRATRQRRPDGTVAWWEHLEAWEAYDKMFHNGQSAERMAERGGFGYSELVMFLGHEPTTWRPR